MTLASGGLAERVAVDARLPIRLPGSWSYESGAAAVLALMTGHDALRTVGRLAPGESVLVTAARSGVGQATVRMARELGAGRVIAAARSLRDEEMLRGLGADAVVESGSAGFAAAVLDATDGGGVDVSVDHVGGPVPGRARRSGCAQGPHRRGRRLGGPWGAARHGDPGPQAPRGGGRHLPHARRRGEGGDRRRGPDGPRRRPGGRAASTR